MTETFRDVVSVSVKAEAHTTAPGGVIIDASTSRYLSVSDDGKPIVFINAGAINVYLTPGLGQGFCCVIWQAPGAGQVTFNANGQTMTITGGLTKTSGSGAGVTVFAYKPDNFLITGGLA